MMSYFHNGITPPRPRTDSNWPHDAKLAAFFGWLEKLGERDKVELAYQDAMEQAYGACLEMLLLNIKGFGYRAYA